MTTHVCMGSNTGCARENCPVHHAGKTVADDIHTMIKSVWRNPKRGYNWVRSHWMDRPIESFKVDIQMHIIKCIESKRNQTMCKHHGRIHSGKKGLV